MIVVIKTIIMITLIKTIMINPNYQEQIEKTPNTLTEINQVNLQTKDWNPTPAANYPNAF